MQRISFERVSNRARYSHFVEVNGDIIALASMMDMKEVRVGVVFGQEFPTDEQRKAIAHLASLATGIDPTVVIEFGEGASPFPGLVPAEHPFACFT